MDRITLVTVTYGNRWNLLRRTIQSALAQGVEHCIVVDNGSTENTSDLCERQFGASVVVKSMGSNSGSAGGFHAGLEEAMRTGTEIILLLDDDNELCPGAIAALLECYDSLHEFNKLASVFCVRTNHGAERALRILNNPINSISNSAWGFSFSKLFRHLSEICRGGRPMKFVCLPSSGSLRMDHAPYGGLLFGRDVLEEVGLPNKEFVLYQDDIEYSYRINKKGGSIYLVFSAAIRDLDESWTSNVKNVSQLTMWVSSQEDLKVYYTFRNYCYIDSHFRMNNRFVYGLNCLSYLSILMLYSFFRFRLPRFKLLARAAIDGLTGKLGSERFPLQ